MTTATPMPAQVRQTLIAVLVPEYYGISTSATSTYQQGMHLQDVFL